MWVYVLLGKICRISIEPTEVNSRLRLTDSPGYLSETERSCHLELLWDVITWVRVLSDLPLHSKVYDPRRVRPEH